MKYKKQALRSCPICGNASVNVLHKQQFALQREHPLPPDFDVVACPICDFVYADTPAPKAAYDSYYADHSKYADQGTATGGGGDLHDKIRIEVTAAEIARHVPDRLTRIVDIGCANGGMLAALRDLGFEQLLGIDPSPACVVNTTTLFGIPARQGWLTALPPEAAPADLAILSHVLEHILNLHSAVACIREVLSPGGMFYVEVPDATRYCECMVAPFQDFNIEHINHFSPAALFNLLFANGFEIVAEGQKDLLSPGGSIYPACFAMCRLPHVSIEASKWRRSPEFILSLESYIARSMTMLHDIDERLQSLAQSPVIVWGTGQLTLKLLLDTSLAGANIAMFTDGNPLHHGKTLHGRPIVAPEEIKKFPDHIIVVGSLLHHDIITRRIREELCLANPVLTLA